MAEKRMKILQINSVYGYGSTGRIVRDIHHALQQAGDESHVIYSRKSAIGREAGGAPAEESGVMRISQPLEFGADVVASVLGDTAGLHSQANTKKILAEAERLQPDLIHLHNIHGFYLNGPMLFSFLRRYQKPVVWTLHDCWSYTGYCAYYDYNRCEGWKSGCRHCPYRGNYPYRVFSHSAANLAWKKGAYAGVDLHLAVPSEWLKEELQQSILAGCPCTVIPNSIDPAVFHYQENSLRTRYHLEDRRIYLACASVWMKQKGLLEYQKLSRMLKEGEQLVIIGLSDAQKKLFQNNVLALGSLPAEELREWYSTADSFVNLTLEDNYPTVNLEARSCGCPVITYRTGGSPESAGSTGLSADRGDLAGILRLLRAHSRQTDAVTAPAQQMTQEYLALYHELLDYQPSRTAAGMLK